MTDLISGQAVAALVQVVLIDLALAGDNALVIGLAAAGLPPDRRKRAIAIGVVAATVLRILCAVIATQLLQILGLALAGGILLLWVSLKLWREIDAAPADQDRGGGRLADDACERATAKGPRRKSFGRVVLRIIVADISMSLDNVLAIAGAAREHPVALAFGLLLSIALMGVAANLISRLLHRHRWIAYLGLATILYVACEMIYRGAHELTPLIGAIGLG